MENSWSNKTHSPQTLIKHDGACFMLNKVMGHMPQSVGAVEPLVCRPGGLQSGAAQTCALVGVGNPASHVKQGAI